ncbi:metalloprotease family protein [Virgibacillus salarius]|uniref:metalloprotease family protein n=1 Tax=Virgibacillus salarius TaxID=447199 RepID=UPI0024905A03|nr:metalloprotease family protein [Virgibacillus salarius]WBX80604.1 metalloprotease family protein [Virgibacillus salarius]
MKIRNNLPKSNPQLHIDLIKKGWVPMREPKHLCHAILLSIPLMMVAAILSIGVIHIFSTISFHEFGLTADKISLTINVPIIFMLILLLILHEVFHLIFIPHFITSDKTYLGLTLFGGFVVTEEEIVKSRYILITIAPFIIISIIAPLLLGTLGLLTPALKFLIILNAMASSVDILNLLLILKQVPKNAILTSNGPYTYWRDIEVNEEIK